MLLTSGARDSRFHPDENRYIQAIATHNLFCRIDGVNFIKSAEKGKLDSMKNIVFLILRKVFFLSQEHK